MNTIQLAMFCTGAIQKSEIADDIVLGTGTMKKN